MKSTELRERLNKSEDNIAKIKKTIERHFNQAQKKRAIIESNGWVLDRWRYVGGGPTPNEDAYWTICEYDDKMSDIEGATKKLAEAEKVRDNWQAKLDRQLELESKIQNEIPEVFKQVKNDLVNEWVIYDIAEREKMHALKSEYRNKYTNWKDFNEHWRKLYTYTREDSLNKTDEEFRKIEEKEAEAWLLDLYNRVFAITGKITDCSGITWGGKCLDGIVVGEGGTAAVNTIEAGGYNIQRLHLRTLVKEV